MGDTVDPVDHVDNVASNQVINSKDPLLPNDVGEDDNNAYPRGQPSSIYANLSGVNLDESVWSDDSDGMEDKQLQEALKKMTNKGKARKGFSRSVKKSQVQTAQLKMVASLRSASAAAASASASSPLNGDSKAPPEKKGEAHGGKNAEESSSGKKIGASTRSGKSLSTDHGTPRKPSAIVNLIGESNEVSNSSHEGNMSLHGDSKGTPGSSNKRKKRYYKGGTYGLYLSKKSKRKRTAAAATTKTRREDGTIETHGDESNQSIRNVYSDGDGELEEGDGEYNSSLEELSCENREKSDGKTVTVDDPKQKDSDDIKKQVTPDGWSSQQELVNEESQSSSLMGSLGNVKRKEDATANGVGHVIYPMIKKGVRSSAKGGSSVTSNDKELFKSRGEKILLRIGTSGSIQSSTSDLNPSDRQTREKERSMSQRSTRKKAPINYDICTCGDKPGLRKANVDGKVLFCQAIDSYDGKLVGCCNQIRLSSLFRASPRVPYSLFCQVHLARFRRHHCCPGCGVFCTQGQFLECFAIRKQVHLFHKNCQSTHDHGASQQKCPHCANISEINCVRLEMNGPINESSYYLTQTPVFKPPRARMTLSRLKELPPLLPFNDSSVEYCLPESKRVISLAGLPYGPSRKQLETLITTLNVEKQSQSFRFTNKNFYAVAQAGEVDKVLGLLVQGFDPNYTFEENNNETPLHAAASCGHLVIVHLLVQAGAHLNVLNANMWTPLILSIANKHNDVMRYLLRAGADHNIRGEDGMTALHIAAKCGNLEAVKFIINNRKVDINLQDDGGWTCLVWATEHRHLNIVKILLAKGAEPNIQDDEKNIGIHWACYSGEVNIAYLYLELGCDINATNVHGDTPLHIAARRDNYECITLLLSRGADLSIYNENNETPMMCCPKGSNSALALKFNYQLRRHSAIRKISSEKYLSSDVSLGKEYYQIPIVNGYDSEPAPMDYMYITENCETSCINIDRTITSLFSCDCKDECTSDQCICGAASFRCWYDREGKLVNNFNFADAPIIFECNRACSCWKTCYNRVVQFGISRVRLQVFRTLGKGWGVRALKDIPKGTFVCEYVGEIITDSEADKREDDSYLFDLDNRDGETYCLDARFYGNVARFINHLCEPNLTSIKVFVDHQDLSFPRMALFANRDIKAYEELGFDYGEKFWAIKYRWFTCDCGSANCRYSRDKIDKTLEGYYRRMRDEITSESIKSSGSDPLKASS